MNGKNASLMIAKAPNTMYIAYPTSYAPYTYRCMILFENEKERIKKLEKAGGD